jgi:CRISPR-associated protein, Cmr1 family
MIKFEIITPIIISGIDKNKVELRSSSIKGMLRWWFRFYKSSFLNVDKLRKFENEVFGSTENGCLFYMRILNFPQNMEMLIYV